MRVQFVVSTAFIWCFALVSAFPSHATDENETESLLKLLGYDTFVESFSVALQDTDNQITDSDTGLSVAWDLAAAETFPAPEMMAEIVAAMEGALEASHVKTATDFLMSDLGILVTEMEVFAQQPSQSKIMDEEGASILSDLIQTKAPRLETYTSMIEALGAIDNEVAAAMNLNFAIYSGMSQSGKLPYQLGDAEILELVLSQQDMLRDHIRNRIYISFSYTYRDLTDDDLEEYVNFLTSRTGRALYGAIQVATEEVLSRRAHLFGNRLMQLQGIQEL